MHWTRSHTFAVVMMFVVSVGCDPRPFPPPDVESFIHSAEVPPLGTAADGYPQAQVRIASEEEVDHVLAVRLAVSEEQRTRGLQGVRDLPKGTGLLLVFDEAEHSGGITTDGVRVVLDMAFIDEAGEILSVFTGNPCREQPCTLYDPEQPYRAVLQVPAGWLARHHLGAGDTVSWQLVSENA